MNVKVSAGIERQIFGLSKTLVEQGDFDCPSMLRWTLEDPDEHTGPSHGVPSAGDRNELCKLIECKLFGLFTEISASSDNTARRIARVKAMGAANDVIAFAQHCAETSAHSPLAGHSEACAYWKTLLDFQRADVPRLKMLKSWKEAAGNNPEIRAKTDASPLANAAMTVSYTHLTLPTKA